MIAPLLLALAAAAGQAPAAPLPGGAAGQPGGAADIVTAMTRAGLSPAGIAALRRVEPVARAQAQELRTRGTAVEAEIRAAALAGDLDRAARALRERDALLARYAADRTTNTVGLLRSLSPADRQIMMRTLAGQLR